MKKLLSLALTIVFVVTCLSSVACASYTGGAVATKVLSLGGYSAVTIPAEEVDSAFSIDLKLSALPAGCEYIDAFSFAFDCNGVEVTSVACTHAGTLGYDKLNVGTKYAFLCSGWGMNIDNLTAAGNVIATITFKRVDSAKTATVAFNDNTLVADSQGSSYGKEIGETLTINFESEDPTPTDTPIAEDFKDNVNLSEDGYYAGADEITSGTVSYGDTKIDMGANGKVHTFFAKTPTALKALEYGVTAIINGNEYFFPGKADVEANQAWAIKIVIPEGKFSNGTTAALTSMAKYVKE